MTSKTKIFGPKTKPERYARVENFDFDIKEKKSITVNSCAGNQGEEKLERNKKIEKPTVPKSSGEKKQKKTSQQKNPKSTKNSAQKDIRNWTEKIKKYEVRSKKSTVIKSDGKVLALINIFGGDMNAKIEENLKPTENVKKICQKIEEMGGTTKVKIQEKLRQKSVVQKKENFEKSLEEF